MHAWLIAVLLAMSTVARAQPSNLSEAAVVADEHRAHVRASALARLADERGTDQVRSLGRRLLRDAGPIRARLVMLAREQRIDLAARRYADGMLARLAKLRGLDFDRALLATLLVELQAHLDAIDAIVVDDPQLAALLASSRTLLAHTQREAAWLAAQRR